MCHTVIFSKTVYPNQNRTAPLCSLRPNLQNKITLGWFCCGTFFDAGQFLFVAGTNCSSNIKKISCLVWWFDYQSLVWLLIFLAIHPAWAMLGMPPSDEGRRKDQDQDQGPPLERQRRASSAPSQAYFSKGGRKGVKAKHLDGSFLERNCREEVVTKASRRPCLHRAWRSRRGCWVVVEA